ncbi:MAG: hypothetical protein JWN60_1144 [Acidobacteria bacterium]|jgi:hypothetical protein|nr:hypothetical protein [Acidobacteriota bacterium]
MSDEYDFENDGLDFDDDKAGQFGEFDEFEDFEPEEVQMRTAVLSKNNMYALLCVKTANEGGAICRVDPRENQPSVQIYDDPVKAMEWFTKSLRTSKKNGWQVVYDGLPLQG